MFPVPVFYEFSVVRIISNLLRAFPLFRFIPSVPPCRVVELVVDQTHKAGDEELFIDPLTVDEVLYVFDELVEGVVPTQLSKG